MAAVASVALMVGVQGCGGGSGGSDQSAIVASVRAYVTALAHRNVAGACAVVTQAYWSATAAELNDRLAALSIPPLPSGNCENGLKQLFSSGPATAAKASEFSISNVHVQGRTATAHLTIGSSASGSAAANSRFVKTPAGIWQIDCCTGPQLAQQSATTYQISDGGMEPTLKVGQTVTSDGATIRAHPPALGDIVTFHPPAGADSQAPTCGSSSEGTGHPQPCGVPTGSASSRTFVKRVVGLPGDRIAIVNSRVVRDGAPEPEPYIDPCPAGQTQECNFPKPIVVPAGDYFVLGDNRGASDDSRFWGPVKRSWLIGVVKAH